MFLCTFASPSDPTSQPWSCAGGAPNRPRPRVRAVRPSRGNPWGRSGRLHAPEAPRTGPVSALRRYSSWSPPGRWLNGHNGHFLGQPTRPWVGTPRGVTQVRWAYPTDFSTQTREVHSHIHWALDTYRCFLCDRLGPYAHLPPLMCTSKSTLDLEVNHAVACVRIA